MKNQILLSKEFFPRRQFLQSGAAGILTCLSGKVYGAEQKTTVLTNKSGGKYYYLSNEQRNIHNRWNKDIPPVLKISSGDLVTIETRDASDWHFTPESTVKDIATRDTSKVHPLTGPIYINEAEPGDVLKIDILDFELSEWGWTVTGKDKGILPELLSDSHLKIWTYDTNKEYAELKNGIRVKLAPFCGVMGVAWEETGEFRTIPPRKNGGNMDIRHLTAGTSLYLPVFVRGALFSAGDAHAAQGDGEVCVSAIETDLAVTVRFTVLKGLSIEEPRYESDEYYATTGFGTTILEASKKATRYMVQHLSNRYGLNTEEAYMLCSVAMDLKICETVDMPHYLVSAHIPKDIFVM
ncbi:acetamidase/formamidase family protein [Candidatus Latescibacterota bacterium]